MVEVGVVLLLLYDLDLLGVVFRVRVVVEAAVGGFSEPVVAGLELVGVVGVVVFLGGLVDEFLGVGALGAEGEGGAGVLVGGFDVLVIASVAGELGRVGAEFGGGSFAVEEILGVGPLNFIAIFALEAVLVDGVDVEVITFEFVVFLVVVDFVGDELFVVVAALVDRVLGEFGLDNFHSTQMSAAVAILAEAFVVVFEIDIC